MRSSATSTNFTMASSIKRRKDAGDERTGKRHGRHRRRKKLERAARAMVPDSPYAVHPKAAGKHSILSAARRKVVAVLTLRTAC